MPTKELGPIWVKPGREVSDYDLLFIQRGKGRMRLRHGWAALRPGVCLWLRPGWPYWGEQDRDNPVCHSFIHFTLVDAQGHSCPPLAPLPPEHIEPPDIELVEAMVRRIIDLCHGFAMDTCLHAPPYDAEANGMSEVLLKAVLMELDLVTDRSRREESGRLAPHHTPFIRRVALQIADNPGAIPSVNVLARQFGCSVSHFSRTFKRVTGRSPETFIVQSRQARAERLLRETALPVGEIAEAIGYRDVCFFSRQFRQFHGLSPLQYRRAPSADGTQAPRKRK
ncbi:MAG: AraC family transcriptional regulator [Kiritimatiellae bacterium]|nr:AraC family transcriptional regulator [Kiritimatiellia bacterium]